MQRNDNVTLQQNITSLSEYFLYSDIKELSTHQKFPEVASALVSCHEILSDALSKEQMLTLALSDDAPENLYQYRSVIARLQRLEFSKTYITAIFNHANATAIINALMSNGLLLHQYLFKDIELYSIASIPRGDEIINLLAKHISAFGRRWSQNQIVTAALKGYEPMAFLCENLQPFEQLQLSPRLILIIASTPGDLKHRSTLLKNNYYSLIQSRSDIKSILYALDLYSIGGTLVEIKSPTITYAENITNALAARENADHQSRPIENQDLVGIQEQIILEKLSVFFGREETNKILCYQNGAKTLYYFLQNSNLLSSYNLQKPAWLHLFTLDERLPILKVLVDRHLEIKKYFSFIEIFSIISATYGHINLPAILDLLNSVVEPNEYKQLILNASRSHIESKKFNALALNIQMVKKYNFTAKELTKLLTGGINAVHLRMTLLKKYQEKLLQLGTPSALIVKILRMADNDYAIKQYINCPSAFPDLEASQTITTTSSSSATQEKIIDTNVVEDLPEGLIEELSVSLTSDLIQQSTIKYFSIFAPDKDDQPADDNYCITFCLE